MRKKILVMLIIGLSTAFSTAIGNEEGEKNPTARHISEEDMEVINHLEILELMEVAEDLQLLREMDILVEDEDNAKEN